MSFRPFWPARESSVDFVDLEVGGRGETGGRAGGLAGSGAIGMLGRPLSVAGLENAGDASAAVGSDGFATSTEPGVGAGAGSTGLGARTGALGVVSAGTAVTAGALTAPPAGAAVVRGLSLNLPGSSAVGAGAGVEGSGAGTRSGGRGVGVIVGRGAGATCGKTGSSGRGAAFAVLEADGSLGRSCGVVVVLVTGSALKRGLSRRGGGDWGSLLMSLTR